MDSLSDFYKRAVSFELVFLKKRAGFIDSINKSGVVDPTHFS